MVYVTSVLVANGFSYSSYQALDLLFVEYFGHPITPKQVKLVRWLTEVTIRTGGSMSSTLVVV